MVTQMSFLDRQTAEYIAENAINQFQAKQRNAAYGSSKWANILCHGDNHAIGNFGTKIIKDLAESMGFSAYRWNTNRNRYDLVINEKRVEVKTGSLQHGGYAINQVRDQDYDYIVCVFPTPQDAIVIFTIPRKTLLDNLKDGHGQHGGKDKKDTKHLKYSLKTWRKKYGNYEGEAIFNKTFKGK